MSEHTAVIDRWLTLTQHDLIDNVRPVVRNSPTSPLWATVGAHPVLAARVRGILSILQAQMAEHRDSAMWKVWIAQARRAMLSGATTISPAKQPEQAQPRPAPAPSVSPRRPPTARPVFARPVFLAAGQSPTR
ncbi:hypothetical protein [Kibdelosporangium phytohabitans]|uniref:Uncharacterized protein n=1 Tax=Kibdelosporangium phytohabitans TaxID=860235 RepID=A0A0N9I1P0_9PSEU|nr:hypothetical protein [Kibdelosporangium phytohabitans]ALG08347.1 hypothetical protein AOZ06_16795 [Kibdelosporangium phytohabitans]MBE1470615.1 hypothetical protein [Kibdelosporangium phytohabitans]